MKNNLTSCPRCGSYDIKDLKGPYGSYLRCNSCKSNISDKELKKWHFINNYTDGDI